MLGPRLIVFSTGMQSRVWALGADRMVSSLLTYRRRQFSANTLFGEVELRSMRLGRFIYALMFCSVCFGQEQNTFSDCQKKASSQRDLQVCADHEFRRVEAAMTQTYHQLLTKAKCDPVAEKKIEAAQQSWLAFRDTQLEATYPHEDKEAEYGSAYPMCALLLKTELTRQRTRMLNKMLNPIEGDVCDAGLHYSGCAAQAGWKSQMSVP